METSIWRYELVSVQDHSRKREGVLLRYLEPTHYGYADCHPWPELGDPSINEQLQAYRTDEGTALLIEGFSFALSDSGARAAGVSLFKGLEVPNSHASLHDAVQNPDDSISEFEKLKVEGFDRVKIKLNSLANDACAVAQLGIAARALGLKLRLDLNSAPTFAATIRGLSDLRALTDGLDWIDWIEDPCPFNPGDWKALGQNFNVRLALDLAADPLALNLNDSIDVIVLKPAVQDHRKIFAKAAESNLPICVTSYLDHPVGQCFAAWVAAKAFKQGFKLETCGLITHTVYQPNAFSERLGTDGPRLIPPEGTGIGFDDLLEKLPWEELP
jgi:O-succinylbenzoate synthase